MRWEDAFTKKSRRMPDRGPAEPRIVTGRPYYEGSTMRDRGGMPVGTPGLPPLLQKMHRYLDDIWANIYLESHERQTMLMLCGAVPGEGCTFISFHLALFLALQHNLKVLYVDTDTGADGGEPAIPGIEHHAGLASYFAFQQALPSLTLRSEYDNLFVLPSGYTAIADRIPNRNSIFKKEAVESFMSYCRGNFDITIIDSQPIAFNPVMIGLARPLGRVVLVCRYGYSRREVSKITIEKLRKNNISVLGVILNEREYPIPPWMYNILK